MGQQQTQHSQHTETAWIPPWVAPPHRAVIDCHWIAHSYARQIPGSRYAQIVETLNWATTGPPTREQAEDVMMAADGGAYDTIVWLLGHRPAPLRLPRRNPDGSLLTEDQLYDEYMAEKWGEPEERREAENRAGKDAATYRRLAALVPH